MLGQGEIIIAWLKNNEVVLISDSKEEPKKLVVPATILSDMEVKNKDELYSLIKTWVSDHPYNKAEVVWVLDPGICFSKVFTTEKKEELDTAVVKYLEILPFQDTYNRIYDTAEGGKLVIAINKSLLDAFKQGFEVQGYETRAEIPAERMVKDWSKRGPVKEIHGYISSHLSELSKERIVDTLMFPHKEHGMAEGVAAPKPKSQLKLLLIVFGVLLLILGIVIYVTYK